MTDTGITTLFIIITNIVFSYQGLEDHLFFDRYAFDVEKILIQKDYKRLVTSGFLHVSWIHLILNMASLCFFTGGVDFHLGIAQYLLIYFASMVGGNLFALLVHRKHGDYSAVGAAGAVSGIMFASIALFPGLEIGFFGVHFPIPAWIYGLLFILYSIYGIRSKKDNIGHEAHLGSALVGLIIAVLMEPVSILHNYLTLLALTVPCIFFIYIIITKPRFLLIDNHFFYQHKKETIIEHIYHSEKVDQQREIDLILEKIHLQGIGSLSKKEKEKLDYYSKILQ